MSAEIIPWPGKCPDRAVCLPPFDMDKEFSFTVGQSAPGSEKPKEIQASDRSDSRGWLRRLCSVFGQS